MEVAEDPGGRETTLRDYLHVLQRRKWIVLVVLGVFVAGAVAYSLQQQRLYQATAQVLLSTQNLAGQLTSTQQPISGGQTPERIAQTQADVAILPNVARNALRRAGNRTLTPQQLLKQSSVLAQPNADILEFSVTNHDPSRARRLVDAYANAYTAYRRFLDTSSIQLALVSVNSRLRQLNRAGQNKTNLYGSLLGRQQTLQTLSTLQTSNASVVQQAGQVTQTQPQTTRNVVLGVVFGLGIGLLLAFLAEALDTRVRTGEEIAERLGAPLLGRIPTPPKRVRSGDKLVALEEPKGAQAEAFRILRTNLDFVILDRDPRAIMITSAVEAEGKTTTLANLAVTLARVGKRVVLVELDLRRPYLARLFGLDGPGVSQVALGQASLEDALASISISAAGITSAADNGAADPNGGGAGYRGGNGDGEGIPLRGSLEVLPCGLLPPDPGEFVSTHAVGEILRQLRDRADIVLIDAPPMLHVGDARAISQQAEGILVVTRIKTIRRHMLGELRRELAAVPTPVLGFIITGADHDDAYTYGYGYGYGESSPQPSTAQESVEAASPQ